MEHVLLNFAKSFFSFSILSINIFPSLGSSKPEISFNNVDLPDPLLPIIPTILFLTILKFMSLNIAFFS